MVFISDKLKLSIFWSILHLLATNNHLLKQRNIVSILINVSASKINSVLIRYESEVWFLSQWKYLWYKDCSVLGKNRKVEVLYHKCFITSKC